MKPIIVLVGRPNVGKSTLFNRLTRGREALVADEPGLTRDRKYGDGEIAGHAFIVVDTGGIEDRIGSGRPGMKKKKDKYGIPDLVLDQTLQAVEEADVILFLVDGREGINPVDEEIAKRLRGLNRKIRLCINKAEGLDREIVSADFYRLGLGEPFPISAAHGDGVTRLMQEVLAGFPRAEAEEDEDLRSVPCIAVVGRPNVGKSTLINAILGEERVLVFDQPGTTRDSIRVPFEYGGRRHVFIDTAGVRRRPRVREKLEKFSIVKTLQSIDEANVVILVLDAAEGVTEQDASLAGYVLERGKAIVVVLNKRDRLDKGEETRLREEVDRKLPFLGFARFHYISALHKRGIGAVLDSVDRAFRAANARLATPELNDVLARAVEQTSPPVVKGRRIRLKYAHQGGKNPPVIVIHGNQVGAVPAHYRRYLINVFRKHFSLEGTPIRIEFKAGANPYPGRGGRKRPGSTPRRRRTYSH